MKIDNGQRVRLTIQNVFDGVAGLSRGKLAFKPKLGATSTNGRLGGILDGQLIILMATMDPASGMCVATFEVPA